MVKYRDSVKYRAPGVKYGGVLPVPVIDDYIEKPSLIVTDMFGVPKVELPNASLQNIKWILNDADECNYTNPIDDERIWKWPGEMPPPVIGRDELQVRIGNRLIWQGIHQREKQNNENAAFQVYGLLSYLWARFIMERSLDFDSVDQLSIAWGLLDYAQEGDKNFNISSSNWNPSGKIRSRRYELSEHKNILDLVKEFPTLIDGFDYSVEITPDGARREFTPWYPYRGTVKPAVALELGRNLTDFNISVDATTLANDVIATGGTSGDVKFEQRDQNDDSISTYGVHQAIVSEGAQQDIDWLLARAQKESTERANPAILPDLRTIEAPLMLLNYLVPGDFVPAKIDRGRAQFNGLVRVMSINWDVPNRSLQLEVQ